MQNTLHPTAIWTDLAEMTLGLERNYGLSRLKRSMLVMLAGWLGYFVVVSMSVRALNKVTVPLLDMPLGVFLAAQGTAVIFLAALILLVKASGRANAAG
jgi:putative solute:sodium symporter small subunit